MKTLYMIGNTHFDPAWLWTWDEAMAGIRATFRAALDRMKEDESFVYSFSTPAVSALFPAITPCPPPIWLLNFPGAQATKSFMKTQRRRASPSVQ